MRREILKQPDISERVKQFIKDEAQMLAGSPQITSADFESMVKDVFPFDDQTLDELFDSSVDEFPKVLERKAMELYDGREVAFTPEIMRKVERDIYLQILDNLWMKHLEDMDHMRQGIHWISVGQRDPLVEYRRQSQMMFEQMQDKLRREVVRTVFSAQPVNQSEVDRPIETELTRAARRSVDNADKIIEAEELNEEDFARAQANGDLPMAMVEKPSATKKIEKKKTRNKKRKAERKRRKKGRR